MSAPPSSYNQTPSSPWVLFGIDLSTVGQDWLEAMRRLYGVAPLRWFELNPAIHVLRSDGIAQQWQAGQLQALNANARANATPAPFLAIELSENLILRRNLSLPNLPSAQIKDAVALDLMSSSPFQADDIAWGYVQMDQGDGVQIHSAFASRSQIAQYLNSAAQQYGWPSDSSEVWAFVPGTAQPIILQGYAESLAEQARNKRRLQASVALLVLAGLAGALAITPTLQLRQQAIQAETAYQQLLAQTSQLTQERALFTKALDSVAQIKQYNEERINPLEVLELLSDELPEDVSVTSLEIENQTIELTAEADNAAAIIQALSELDSFAEVRSTRPVQQVARANKERFTVEMLIAKGAFDVKYSQELFVEPTPAEDVIEDAIEEVTEEDQGQAPPINSSQPLPTPAAPTAAIVNSDLPAATSRATIGGGSVRRGEASNNSGVAPPPAAPQPLKPPPIVSAPGGSAQAPLSEVSSEATSPEAEDEFVDNEDDSDQSLDAEEPQQ